MTDPARSPAGPPAGWYPDPSDNLRLRWWDGSTWGYQTRPLPPSYAADTSRPAAHSVLPAAHMPQRRVKPWLILGGIGIVVLVTALIALVARSATPTYQQGYNYAAKYMAVPNGGNLIVPVSFLPKVCGGIAKSNPYGVPGAPGANPGAAWVRGCEAAIKASPNFLP